MCSGHGCEVAPRASSAPPCLRPCTPLRRWGHGPGACHPPPPPHTRPLPPLCRTSRRSRGAAVCTAPPARRALRHAGPSPAGLRPWTEAEPPALGCERGPWDVEAASPRTPRAFGGLGGGGGGSDPPSHGSRHVCVCVCVCVCPAFSGFGAFDLVTKCVFGPPSKSAMSVGRHTEGAR